MLERYLTRAYNHGLIDNNNLSYAKQITGVDLSPMDTAAKSSNNVEKKVTPSSPKKPKKYTINELHNEIQKEMSELDNLKNIKYTLLEEDRLKTNFYSVLETAQKIASKNTLDAQTKRMFEKYLDRAYDAWMIDEPELSAAEQSIGVFSYTTKRDLSNYENRGYFERKICHYSKLDKLRIKCDVTGKFIHSTQEHKPDKDPILLKLKMPTHFGDYVEFTEKEGNLRGRLTVNYTITESKAIELEDVIDDKVVTLDNRKLDIHVEFKDIIHNQRIIYHIEGNERKVNDLLYNVAVELLREMSELDRKKYKSENP